MFNPDQQPMKSKSEAEKRLTSDPERNSWNEHLLETLTGVMEKNTHLNLLDNLFESKVAHHPEFAAFKSCVDTDLITQDEAGNVYIRKGCRCKDGSIKVLGVEFRLIEDEYGKGTKIIYFSEEVPNEEEED